MGWRGSGLAGRRWKRRRTSSAASRLVARVESDEKMGREKQAFRESNQGPDPKFWIEES